MLHVGCGSVGLILACAASAATTAATPPSANRIDRICASEADLAIRDFQDAEP
jgi:hypothetical protein